MCRVAEKIKTQSRVYYRRTVSHRPAGPGRKSWGGDDRFQRSFTHHGRGAQKLGHRPASGLSCCRSALADRTLHSACPDGCDVGGDRSNAPDRATLWADPRIVGSCFRRNHQVDGLGAPSRCARALCRDCPARRSVAPAIHHEKNGSGTCLGIHFFAYRARIDLAILGSPGGPALTSSFVCVPSATKRFRNTLAARQGIGAVVGNPGAANGFPACRSHRSASPLYVSSTTDVAQPLLIC